MLFSDISCGVGLRRRCIVIISITWASVIGWNSRMKNWKFVSYIHVVAYIRIRNIYTSIYVIRVSLVLDDFLALMPAGWKNSAKYWKNPKKQTVIKSFLSFSLFFFVDIFLKIRLFLLILWKNTTMSEKVRKGSTKRGKLSPHSPLELLLFQFRVLAFQS